MQAKDQQWKDRQIETTPSEQTTKQQGQSWLPMAKIRDRSCRRLLMKASMGKTEKNEGRMDQKTNCQSSIGLRYFRSRNGDSSIPNGSQRSRHRPEILFCLTRSRPKVESRSYRI